MYCNSIGIRVVEDEKHVLLECPLYIDIRNSMLLKANELFQDFGNKCCEDQIKLLLSEEVIVNVSAKACYMMLDKRRCTLYDK